MDTRTIELPFARTVTLRNPHPGTGSHEALVVETLPLTLPAYDDPVSAAVESFGGLVTSLRHVIGGIPYGGHLDEQGLSPKDAAKRMARLVADSAHDLPSRRVHATASLTGLDVADFGHDAQERDRSAMEANATLVNGLLMIRKPLPRIELRTIGDGSVRMDIPTPYSDGTTSTTRFGKTPAWMTFDVGAVSRARDMAEAVAESNAGIDPALNWHRSRISGVEATPLRHVRWRLRAPDALDGVSLTDGGPGTPRERSKAMAVDLVQLLAPHIGRFGDPVLRAFADLRETLARGDDPADGLQELVAVLSGDEFKRAAETDPVPARGELASLKASIAALDLRLRRFEPAPEAEAVLAPR